MSTKRIAVLAFVLWLGACTADDAGSSGPPALQEDAATLDAAMSAPDAARPTTDAAPQAPIVDAATMPRADSGALDAMASPDAQSGDDAGHDAGPLGPNVDRTEPQLHALELTANEADAEATQSLGEQLAALDTRVAPIGKLVVFLHGASDSAPARCGSSAHGEMLAGLGFHVFQPCYNSYYGVGNCGQDIGGCRLEAFEGVDRHPSSRSLRRTRSWIAS